MLLFMKEWHYYFMPKYEYDYFLDRCQGFGEKKADVKVTKLSILFIQI